MYVIRVRNVFGGASFCGLYRAPDGEITRTKTAETAATVRRRAKRFGYAVYPGIWSYETAAMWLEAEWK